MLSHMAALFGKLGRHSIFPVRLEAMDFGEVHHETLLPWVI